MNTASKGRRNEYKTKELLKADGYIVTRSAASKGSLDLIGIRADSIVLVQVKTNKACPPEELKRFREMPAPSCCKKAVYVWKDYAKSPEIISVN